MNLSDEERERRRQNALELKKQGKIGPQYGKLGGRPRKPRAMEKVAEAATQEADKIIQVFKDGVDDESMKTRLAAANSWLAIENEETKLRLAEERQDFDIGQASREELLKFVATAISSGPVADQLGEFVDGSATDITDVGGLGHNDPEENSSGNETD